LRLMDDDFMTAVFSGDNKLTEFLLRILLNRNDLIVTSSMTQKEIHNIFGRSVRLDIFAEDANKKLYNVEIQRADKGADPYRVRMIQSAIDNHTLQKGNSFKALPETYIIFITENDIIGDGKAVHEVDKKLGGKVYDDGTHSFFVNGAYNGDDAIGKLMHDFRTPNADEMYYTEIAERVRFHKQQDKGGKEMCRIFEEYGNERAAEARIQAREERNSEIVTDLLRDGTMSLERIATVSRVPLEKVKEMAAKLAICVQ